MTLPTVQRAVEIDELTSTVPPTGGPPTASGTPPTGATGQPRQPSEAELQELARALYPQLRRRLGRDLLLDRERHGYRTDIRF